MRLRGSNGVGFELAVEEYDELGNVKRLRYPGCLYPTCSDPGSMELALSFRQGVLTGIGSFASAISYHPDGQLARIDHENGVTDFRDQATSGWPRLSQIQTIRDPGGTAATLWDSGTYAYDPAGNIKTIGSETFAYDRVGRLVESSTDRGDGTLLARSFSYDPYGNLTALSGANSPPGSLQPSPSTNRLGPGVASYDEAGNVDELDGRFDYRFDPFNRMKHLDGGAIQRSFLYDASDERVASIDLLSGAGKQQWTPRGLGNEVLSRFELDGGQLSWTKDYVHAGSLQLASLEPSPGSLTVRHFHTDHLGSTRRITDETGVPVSAHAYFPFGTTVEDPGFGAEPLQFTGHERDDNDLGQVGDLDYMHARFHSGHYGRFLSPDAVIGNPEAPQTWNRYSYVNNNPIALIDPDGNQEAEAVRGAGQLSTRREQWPGPLPSNGKPERDPAVPGKLG